MNLTDMRARMQRLAKLAQGLAQEASLWKKCNAPVLYVHRLEYMEGIQAAASGLEKARVALAKMIQEDGSQAKAIRVKKRHPVLLKAPISGLRRIANKRAV